MNPADQADTGGDWRMQLRDMRTLSDLRADTPQIDALRRLSDRALRAAAINPDHSEAARQAADEELRARNAGAGRWRIAVTGFIRPRDLERRGDKLFFGWGRATRLWSGRAIYAVFAMVVALAFLSPQGAVEIGDPAFTFNILGAELDSELVFGVIGAAALSAIFIWFVSSALRRHPARVLLLRKFNVRAVSMPLGRVIAHELRPYGHVASLSDKHIRRDMFGWVQMALLSLSNPLAAIWFVVGLPIRFAWRLFDRSAMGPAVVLNARDYRNLARRLRDRIGLNVQVAMVAKEAFLVRTADTWWRLVVRLLMDSSDVIVVDLSQVSEGTAWELDVIRDENAGARCVFVSIWGRAAEAEAALRERGFPHDCFYYAPDGEMQRRGQFRVAMLAAMRATHGLGA